MRVRCGCLPATWQTQAWQMQAWQTQAWQTQAWQTQAWQMPRTIDVRAGTTGPVHPPAV